MYVDASAIAAILTPEPDAAKIRTVAITSEEADAALEAFARYGKGRGHPARLNMGDCFACAVAKNHHASLLFKGDDFTQTDIRTAMSPE